MKKEFSQMAFDFPMEAEPQAPPKNGLSAHHGELSNGLGLSAEEANTVHEEGRRAGVVVRIKSLKRSEQAFVADPPPPRPLQPKGPKDLVTQTSILLGDIDLPIVKAEIEAKIAAPASVPDTNPYPATAANPVAASGPMAGPNSVSTPYPVAVPEPVVTAPMAGPDPASPTYPAAIPNPVATPHPVVPPEPTAAPIPAQPAEPPLPRRTRPATSKAKPSPMEKPKSKRGRKSLKEVAAEADLLDIPADEVLFSKQYYTMGEVAEMFHVNQSLLRFWETEFSVLQPRKNRKGDRYFRPIDIKNLHLIYHLLRQRKYTIEGAKEFLRKNKNAEQRFEAIQKLQQIKAFLLELKAQL